MNSGKKPAVGVHITASGSNGTYSKSNGGYTLTFPSYKHGTTVYPKVGDKIVINGNATKEIELVNIDKVRSINIPSDPSKSPIKIVVCPKGYRNATALKYYHLIKSNSDRLLKEKNNQLVSLGKKLDQSNSLIQKLSDQLNLLKQNNDSLVIYKEAMELASINRDDATSRMINYLEALDAGVSLEVAGQILDVNKAFQEALNAEQNIEASIDEIKRNAKNLIQINQFDEAIKNYDTIMFLLERNIYSPLLLVDNLIEASEACRRINYDYKAINYCNRALKILEKFSDIEKRIEILTILGKIHHHNNQSIKAKSCFFKAIELIEKKVDYSTSHISNIKIIVPLDYLARIYRSENNEDSELEILNKLTEILTESKNNIFMKNIDVFFLAYQSKIQIYLRRQKIKKLFNTLSEFNFFSKKAIDSGWSDITLELGVEYSDFLLNIIYNPENRQLAEKEESDLDSIAIYFFKGLLSKSIKLISEEFKKALYTEQDSSKKIALPALNYSLVAEYYLYLEDYLKDYVSYSNTSLNNPFGNMIDSTEIYYQKSLNTLNNLNKVDSSLFRSYYLEAYTGMAKVYRYKRMYLKSEKYLLLSLDILKSSKEKNTPHLAGILLELGKLYFNNIHDYKKAKHYSLESLKIYTELFKRAFKYSNSYSYSLWYLGHSCSKLKEFDEAKKYLNKARNVFQSLINEGNQSFLSSIALIEKQLLFIYNEIGEFDRSETIFLSSLNYFLLENKNDPKIKYDNDIANLYMENGYTNKKLKKYDKAEEAYKNAIHYYEKLPSSEYPNLQYTICDMYANLGRMYLHNNKMNKAKKVFTICDSLTITMEYEARYSDQYLNWAEYFSLLDQKDKAIENLKKAVSYGDVKLDWLQPNILFSNIEKSREFREIIKEVKAKQVVEENTD